MATRTQAQKDASNAKRKATIAAKKAKAEQAAAIEKVENARMTSTLNKYRGGYEPSICAGGRKSLNNGDDLANLLAGLTPESVCALADAALGLGAGFCESRYAKLNRGQRRMNAGNRLRAALKREAITLEVVEAALAKIA
jgi:hypothetical protein